MTELERIYDMEQGAESYWGSLFIDDGACVPVDKELADKMVKVYIENGGNEEVTSLSAPKSHLDVVKDSLNTGTQVKLQKGKNQAELIPPTELAKRLKGMGKGKSVEPLKYDYNRAMPGQMLMNTPENAPTLQEVEERLSDVQRMGLMKISLKAARVRVCAVDVPTKLYVGGAENFLHELTEETVNGWINDAGDRTEMMFLFTRVGAVQYMVVLTVCAEGVIRQVYYCDTTQGDDPDMWSIYTNIVGKNMNNDTVKRTNKRRDYGCIIDELDSIVMWCYEESGHEVENELLRYVYEV